MTALPNKTAHYSRELDTARVHADQTIKANLYQQASKGTGRNAVAAAKAWFQGVGNLAADLTPVARFAEQIGVSKQQSDRGLCVFGNLFSAQLEPSRLRAICFYLSHRHSRNMSAGRAVLCP